MTEPLTLLCRALKIGALVALLVLPATAFAEDASAPHTDAAGPATAGEQSDKAQPEAAETAEQLPPPSITQHSTRLAGVDVPYTAKAGLLPLRDGKGKTLASIFYVAYTREPQDTKRPITFVFNGGPGAASAYLHLGAIGPKAIEANAKGELAGPPSRLVVNEFELARLHRSRVRRSGRHRLQPGERRQKRRRLLRRRAGHRRAGRFHPALSHRCVTPGFAGLSGGRKLWRLPRRDHHARAAENPRHFAERPGADLARARIRSAQWRGLRPAALGAGAALLCCGQSREPRRHRTRGLGQPRCKTPSITR